MSSLRIVFGNASLARYPQGGGHWTVRLQYLLGLHAMGHDVFLLELLWSSGDTRYDLKLVASFFARLKLYGVDDRAALVLFKKGDEPPSFENADVFGLSKQRLREIIEGTEIFWNDCYGVRQPLLSMFRHRVLIDLDPGVLQVGALTSDLDVSDHHAFLSVGSKLHHPDCGVPTLGLTWHTFTPFVYLPMWQVSSDAGAEAPFSSVTHWNRRKLWLQERVLSRSKRDAYLGYLSLPVLAGRPFELAALMYPEPHGGDRELFESQGWRIVDPWKVAGSPASYQRYIARSRAEISCPKPIFRDLKTGWFSDRSVCYLASGRPVLAEDTGFSDVLPTGRGLLAYRDMREAVSGVAEIDGNYVEHMVAAREIAEEFFDSRRCLQAMLEASG